MRNSAGQSRLFGMRKRTARRLVAVFFLCGFLIGAGEAGAITVTAASCRRGDVQAAVDQARDGDAVVVPAGEAIWTIGVVIHRAILLKGAGQGITRIRGDVVFQNVFGNRFALLTYYPANPDPNHRFRLTGFSLNANNHSNTVCVYNPSDIIERIRIDHNSLANGDAYRNGYVVGTVFGVIDNNEVISGSISFYGSNKDQWDNLPRNYGDSDQLYVEDNFFINAGHGAGQGGRYASRYNTYTFDQTTCVMEFHGNQPGGTGCIGDSTCGNLSTQVVEIYGNHWDLGTGGAGNLVDQRGGKSLIFMNRITNGINSAMYAREEYADALWPVGSYEQHVADAYSWANISSKQGLIANQLGSENCCAAPAEEWQPNYTYGTDLTCKTWINDPNGYCWKSTPYGNPVAPGISGAVEPNWAGTAPRYYLADGGIRWLNMGVGSPIREGVDIWMQRPGVFDGTGHSDAGGGVGCGTLAQRPATCTPGVAYWATDQSCTDLSGTSGAHPQTPISGMLYKCVSENTWEVYYTPYTYPHPLRHE